MSRRRNQNLTPKEAKIKRHVAATHKLIISRGPYANQGSAFQLDMSIITGRIATLMLDAKIRDLVIDWINNHIDQVEGDNELVAQAFQSIKQALIAAAEREQQVHTEQGEASIPIV